MSTTIYGNLSNQFPDSTLLTGQVDLKNSIQSLNTNLDAINNKTNTLLSMQDGVSTIINDEQNRLNEKKQIIDTAYSSQLRSIHLNNSMTKKSRAYSTILFVIVFVLIFVFIVSIVGKIFPMIPPFVLNIIYVGLFSFAFIYSYSIYSDIQRHEKIDYDRIQQRKAADAGLDVSGMDVSFNNDISGNVVNGNCAEVNPLTGNCTKLLDAFCGMNHLSSLNSYEFTNYSKY